MYFPYKKYPLLYIGDAVPFARNHAATTRPVYHCHCIGVFLASEPAAAAASSQLVTVFVAALHTSIKTRYCCRIASLLRIVAAIPHFHVCKLNVVLMLGDADGIQLLALGVETCGAGVVGSHLGVLSVGV